MVLIYEGAQVKEGLLRLMTLRAAKQSPSVSRRIIKRVNDRMEKDLGSNEDVVVIGAGPAGMTLRLCSFTRESQRTPYD